MPCSTTKPLITHNPFLPQFSFLQILQPAIDLAEEGFPVAPIAAHLWELGSAVLRDPSNPHGQDMLLSGQAPRAGDIMTMPQLAATFKVLCAEMERWGVGGQTGPFADGWKLGFSLKRAREAENHSIRGTNFPLWLK